MNPHIIQDHDDSRDESRLARLGRAVRAPFARTAIVGSTLLALGLTGLLTIVTTTTHDVPILAGADMAFRSSLTCITVGVILLVYVSLRRRGRSIEEAYRLGYDLGFENGYRAGREARDPVPSPLHPAVEDLAAVGDVVPIRTRRGPAG